MQKCHHLHELIKDELLNDGIAIGLLQKLVVVLQYGCQSVGVILTDLQIIIMNVIIGRRERRKRISIIYLP